MYIVKRTIEMGVGANPAEVLQAAVAIGAYVKNKQGLDTKTTVNFGGYLNQIHWIVMTDSLDILREKTAEREADEEWQRLIAPMNEAGLFKPGSVRDEILSVIG